ncbi:ATP-binding protein [Amnibacterium sp.]|uniref:sensor histidine kinase n=1 Tax=Amnibacterium sp. TaxID=1872496 RepID=UPI00260231FE|nr:ATP-binding protein [Amnibacterium sp.]MCU1472511.1 two-component sensor histidine kinase [Amnibacterium sp.]
MTETTVARWLTVAVGGGRGDEAPVSRRRLVVRVLALALLVAGVVMLGGGLVAQRLADAQAVSSASQRAQILATDVGQPALRNGLVDEDPSAIAALDATVHAHVLGAGGIARVKVWNRAGRIVYSDEPRLIGKTFGLGDDEEQALLSGGTQADISDLAQPENVYDRSNGPLLEVYQAVRTPDGTPLLFEVYFKYDAVRADAGRIWLGFAAVTGVSLLLVLLGLVPVFRGLLRALERGRMQRELLLIRALDASDAERRRVAALLHDGPVQDLVGAGYHLGAASSAVRGTETGDVLDAAETTVRGTVQSLRALLVDIYPPALDRAGLAAGLEDLAAGARTRGVRVSVVVDPRVDLSQDAERLVFRVAREAIANAKKHGDGAPISVGLAVEGGSTVLTVHDDGPGFDAEGLLSKPKSAHFGLRLLRDAVSDSGVDAELSLRSAPAAGTTWRLTIRE